MPPRMHRRSVLLTSLLLVISSSPAAANDQKAATKTSPPNIVFFLVDDLGYMDISPNNPDTFYETPNLERLAASGMRFTDGYAANPVCSPTRFSILTGRYPTRVQATNWFSGVRSGRFLPAPLNDQMSPSEWTLAEALKTSDYRTYFLGKWHLGKAEELWPEHQGFDVNIGGHDRGSPPGGYFAPFKNPRMADGPKGEHLTSRLTDEAEKLLQKTPRDQPFLLYLAYYTVHTPLQAPPELVRKYERKAAQLPVAEDFEEEEQVWPGAPPRKVRIRQNHSTYAAMVETMDTSIGRILDQLEKLGLAENTVICFMSDNGGLSTAEGSPTSNLPLRGGKGWVYEGGIREPWLIRWPGKTPAGSVCDVPVSSIDFFPTLCEIGEVTARAPLPIDGVSLVPLLTQQGKISERSLYWHYPHYSNQGGFPGGAIRRGPWKLVERYEDGMTQLFHLENDPGERDDRSQQEPAQAAALRADLHRWYQQVDARFLEKKDEGTPPWHPLHP